jgi:hypothetical protein
MSAVNHTTVACVFSESMEALWPGSLEFDNVLLLVTGAPSYMIKAAKELQ